MKNILAIHSSLFEENSVSSLLTNELIADLRAEGEEFELVERDFRSESIPHLDGKWLQALSTDEAERDSDQQAKVKFSDSLIEELMEADTILIGLPMYNFSVPSMLKAWIDHIARAGETFKYTETGSVGLLTNKRVFLLTAMGGIHEPGKTDFLRPYMKQALSFVGLEDVEFITADGFNMGPEKRGQGLSNARDQIRAAASALTNDTSILTSGVSEDVVHGEVQA